MNNTKHTAFSMPKKLRACPEGTSIWSEETKLLDIRSWAYVIALLKINEDDDIKARTNFGNEVANRYNTAEAKDKRIADFDGKNYQALQELDECYHIIGILMSHIKIKGEVGSVESEMLYDRYKHLVANKGASENNG